MEGTRFHAAQNMEGVIHGDIDGDGDDDILCNHWAGPRSRPDLVRAHRPGPLAGEHVVGTEGEFHGNGLGDVNGDGRTDIVAPKAGTRQPATAAEASGPSMPITSCTGRPAGRVHSRVPSHARARFQRGRAGRHSYGASHEYGLAGLEEQVDAQGKRSVHDPLD